MSLVSLAFDIGCHNSTLRHHPIPATSLQEAVCVVQPKPFGSMISQSLILTAPSYSSPLFFCVSWDIAFAQQNHAGRFSGGVHVPLFVQEGMRMPEYATRGKVQHPSKPKNIHGIQQHSLAPVDSTEVLCCFHSKSQVRSPRGTLMREPTHLM